MPPRARPIVRADTDTTTDGSCRIRASMRASARTNARSSPDGSAGMPPARRNAAGVTARLAPAASVWRGRGSAGSGSSLSAIRSSSSINRHSSASSTWRWTGMSTASDGWSTDSPAHNIGTRGDRLEIALNPVRRRHGVGVRRQENAIRPHPLFREAHCQADAPDRHWRAELGSHGMPHPTGRAAPAPSRTQSRALHHCNCWQVPPRREAGMSGEPTREDKPQCVRPHPSREAQQR